MSKAIAVTSQYRNMPLAQLQESPTNPRRRFEEGALTDLAASFLTQGVLQPLLVRAIQNDRFEVVAGARRFRAARIAGLAEVPVRVVELSDAAVRESQLTENLLREDVHPYEEALALEGLLRIDGGRYDIHSIASRLGKSPAYITTRIRLTHLAPSIAEAFLADQIGVGHALEIAKLPQSEQQRAFDTAFRAIWSGGKESRVLLPLRDFIGWIEQNILLSLEHVPFDKDDAQLVPAAGSCAECPKRTGVNTFLFGVMSERDRCSDNSCYQSKRSAHLHRQLERTPSLVQISTAYGAPTDGALLSRRQYVALDLLKSVKSKQPLLPNQKPCKHMKDAIAVDGAECGRPAKICAELTCPVHFADRHTLDPTQVAKVREQRRKELEKRKVEITVRHRVLAEVLKKVGSPLDRVDLLLIATAMLEKTEPLSREALARRHKAVDTKTGEVTYPQLQKGLTQLLRRLDEGGLSKLMVEMVLLGLVETQSSPESDPLMASAKRHRVDMAKLRTAVEAELSSKQKKIMARKKQLATKSTEKATKAA